MIDPEASGRGLEVLVDVEIAANDLRSFADFEESLAAFDEVVELHRLFGRPDYYLRVAVANHEAYEVFLTGRPAPLPGVVRITSHLSMKKIKSEY
ncbi:MAG TPA: Lrp/AsnC ligand binding domain-containing protein [Actinospica sp.]|nr:Lrp/AsnC ligand binding domain-containing protein [Actinospica sp.]HWG25267.1 Lrp/AsnC ligand binding domain-containing protein [Actinospica sp.]